MLANGADAGSNSVLVSEAPASLSFATRPCSKHQVRYHYEQRQRRVEIDVKKKPSAFSRPLFGISDRFVYDASHQDGQAQNGINSPAAINERANECDYERICKRKRPTSLQEPQVNAP